MKKILWISRHCPTPEMRKELEEILGDRVEILQSVLTVFEVDPVVDLFKTGNYDDIVVILPFDKISKLIKFGISPLHPVMDPIRTFNGSKWTRDYEFKGYERVRSVYIKRERLGKAATLKQKKNKFARGRGVSRDAKE